MSKPICPVCFTENAEDAERCLRCGALILSGAATSSQENIPAEENSMDYQKGDLIADRYEVHELIGRGGMGTVYKVHDQVLDEELALKVLLPEFVADTQVVERFMNEVRISRKIAHPNIVRIHDIGHADETMFISMEYVNGSSLRSILDKRGKSSHMSLRQSIYIISQLCIALKYAHRYMVHRDIKPDNIMVTRNNHIKLMDFGISKLKDNRYESDSGVIVGTPYYMAPEQIHNAPDVDGRADIYSLGVVLYELLTGTLPTGIQRSLSHDYDYIPAELEVIIFRCLEQNREHRFQNPSELRDALQLVNDSLLESSAPGILSSQMSGVDPSSSNLSTSVLASAMESFLRDGVKEISSDSGVDSASGGKQKTPHENTGGSVSEYLGLEEPRKRTSSIQPRPAPPGFFQEYKYLIGIVIVLLAMSSLFFLRKQVWDLSENLGIVVTETESVDPQEQADKLLAVADKFQVLIDVCTSYRKNKTPEGHALLEAVRDHFFETIEARAYARPFNLKSLNEASLEAVQAAQVDGGARMVELAEAMTREASYFKFVLTRFDSEEGTAEFRLNNPYIDEETQTVSVGDSLADRFLVVSITSQAVHLEDTHPKSARRPLVARLMERVSDR
ncbi:MAG: serine/threonine protein kinase [Candidatus Hydrogenedens sp.]|jgi:serine/threonine protein kinase|nr:serine/threonine protein kinase [Candidatus Hydrogenedens sp.]